MMESLVVGGTGFLGHAIAEQCLRIGHDVTVLSRGQAARPPPDGVNRLRADLHDPLDMLRGARFDFVFDCCAFAPWTVCDLLGVFAAPPERYALISSTSVYASFAEPYVTETEPTPVATAADLAAARALPAERRTDAGAYGASYGRLKRACEIAAEDGLGDRALILRAGVLVGAGDPTDRLTWWLRRIDAGGRVPAPAPWNRSVQIIDVRDMAAFAVAAATVGRSGAYNVTGPDMPLALLLETTVDVAGSGAELVWVNERRFWEAGVKAWSDLPLVPPPTERFRHFLRVDTDRARRDGLTYRPLAETLRQMLEWDRADRDRPLRCGMPPRLESAILN